ncbi:hypothetical protein RF11_03836 [Thelohanellus kitauei]|uniref:ZP domain-containing protein n=1 Tax=Thelohanellus kitauei TaxID=669202 RepID=A0A0C2N4U7_THEKT|nr:hypothetical protein RF11_03836 [Thelohanellus kitauei]
MYVSILSLFATVSFIHRAETRQPQATTYNISLEDTKIYIELSATMRYLSSENQLARLFNTDIKNFTLDASEFFLKLESDETNSWFEMKCQTLDSENEIELIRCNISVQTKPTDLLHNYQLNNTYRFNKNTKYEFSELKLKLHQPNIYDFEFTIFKILIRHSCYSQTCEKQYSTYTPINGDPFSKNLVYPCVTDYAILSDETDVLRHNNQIECISKKSSSSRIILVIVFACMTVLECIIILVISIRWFTMKETPEVQDKTQCIEIK